MSGGACDAPSNAPISVISGPSPHALPECEMDALLLGRTRYSDSDAGSNLLEGDEEFLKELVAASPGRRNWRGIFIALLVIAAVLGLIVFSIFLLSPEDEGLRIRGRRLTLSDLSSTSLKWKSFNGTWISDVELVYRDPTGGLSILNLENYTIRVLMTNSTFRQLNADQFLVSPDIKYVLLASDTERDGTSNYHVYEVQTQNHFPLSSEPRNPPRLQRVLWAPNTITSKLTSLSQSLVQTQAAAAMGGTVSGLNGNYNGVGGTTGNSGNKMKTQAIAFVYKNDVYFKPKVKSDLVCRITTTGEDGIIYNGVPNWMYSNTPELQSETLAFSPDSIYLAFLQFNDSQVREYQYSWLGDNQKYPSVKSVRYAKATTVNPNVTVLIANLSALKLIDIQQIRLPASVKNGSYIGGMTWISNKDLSVTVTERDQGSAVTFICRAPQFNCREIHVESILDNGWVTPAETPIYSKLQTQFRHSADNIINIINSLNLNSSSSSSSSSSNINNKPPNENTFNVLSDSITLGSSNKPNTTTSMNSSKNSNNTNSNNSNNSNITIINITSTSSKQQNEFEFETGGYLLKRLPVRDGEHGYYRHVVFVSPSDMRTVPITMGRFEVTEILGWDEQNEIVYFMAAPESKPGQRHLYKINLKLNATENSTRVYITSTTPKCLTCDNSWTTFRILNNITEGGASDSHGEPEDFDIPNNCLYNRIYFSKGYSYYVQECLGPDTPSVYLVDTKTNTKIFVLHHGDGLRAQLYHLATPQIRIFNVEIRHGFQAQVRLFLPPGMKEEEEIAFPLILQIDSAPGSQLVSEKYDLDWNWYLCSQKSMIIAQIDARGSGYQGELMKSQIKGHLGTVEIEDQLGVLTYLRENLKFVDPTRICAYGWGYGGYAVTMTLSEDSNRVLQCAVAINPVVSFAYHNSFFTERYIQQNDDYLRALQDSDLTIRAGNLDTRNFLLIHGTADTVIHPQHSLMLAKALIEQSVPFRQQVYADEDHELTGVRHHLYKTIENYFDESFGPLDTNDWDPTGFFAFKQ